MNADPGLALFRQTVWLRSARPVWLRSARPVWLCSARPVWLCFARPVWLCFASFVPPDQFGFVPPDRLASFRQTDWLCSARPVWLRSAKPIGFVPPDRLASFRRISLASFRQTGLALFRQTSLASFRQTDWLRSAARAWIRFVRPRWEECLCERFLGWRILRRNYRASRTTSMAARASDCTLVLMTLYRFLPYQSSSELESQVVEAAGQDCCQRDFEGSQIPGVNGNLTRDRRRGRRGRSQKMSRLALSRLIRSS
jgi:hypothetical protein